jgi:hypothetical protein
VGLISQQNSYFCDNDTLMNEFYGLTIWTHRRVLRLEKCICVCCLQYSTVSPTAKLARPKMKKITIGISWDVRLARSLPFKYLGIPIHYRKLRNKEWNPIEDRFERKLASWLGKLLSYGNWLVLINSVLSSLPMFLFSYFEVSKRVRKRLDFYRS